MIHLKNAAFYHNLHFYDYALKLLFEVHAELVEIMKDAVTVLRMQLTQSLKRPQICKGSSSWFTVSISVIYLIDLYSYFIVSPWFFLSFHSILKMVVPGLTFQTLLFFMRRIYLSRENGGFVRAGNWLFSKTFLIASHGSRQKIGLKKFTKQNCRHCRHAH